MHVEGSDCECCFLAQNSLIIFAGMEAMDSGFLVAIESCMKIIVFIIAFLIQMVNCVDSLKGM